MFFHRKKVKARGLSFTLSCENAITRYRLREFPSKEPLTLDWIDTLAGEKGVFFDIGANVGVFSIYAALKCPKMRLIAFEPEYSNLHLLKENILKNGLQERITPYGVALGRASGLSFLHLQDFTPGSAKHTVSMERLEKTGELCPVIWREGVATYTLDRFCSETGIFPNFIKLDVDGNEPDILEGGKETLAGKNLRSMMMEFSHDSTINARCAALLEQAGFKLRAANRGERLGIWARR